MSEDLIETVNRTAMTREWIALDGKVAVVTGGGAGIGRGIAVALAEFGADVAIIDKDESAAELVAGLVRDKGRRGMAVVADVMDRDACRAGVDRVMAQLGRLDVLVNNAGGVRPLRLIEMTDRQVDRHLDLNLKSVIALTQAAAKAMIAGGEGGSVINVASIEGMRAAPSYSVYSAAKAGVLNLTRTAALELAEHGIRVNALAPDIVPTEHLVRYSATMLSPEGRRTNARYIPLGRIGTFDDCAGAAVFLASRMAAYITGVTISVDGGTWASSGWTREAEGDGWRLIHPAG